MAGRFFRRGKSLAIFAPTVAILAAPTAPELAAGTPLSVQISDITGFEFQNSPIATPDLSSTFTATIPGEDTASDPTITFYDLDNPTNAIRTALLKGSAGFVVLLPYGQVSTRRCEVWPVTSTGVNDMWTTGNEAAKYGVKFAVTGTPAQTAVVP